ncbi:hypothetical protein CPB85DRAFT_1253894 [Mucidula mucida]|nr:hypothetical protein CPB85DRAFT_1253894 [Mucidula mucida]
MANEMPNCTRTMLMNIERVGYVAVQSKYAASNSDTTFGRQASGLGSWGPGGFWANQKRYVHGVPGEGFNTNGALVAGADNGLSGFNGVSLLTASVKSLGVVNQRACTSTRQERTASHSNMIVASNDSSRSMTATTVRCLQYLSLKRQDTCTKSRCGRERRRKDVEVTWYRQRRPDGLLDYEATPLGWLGPPSPIAIGCHGGG